MVKNKHKGMNRYGIWLTKAESDSLKESLKLPERNWAKANIVEIIDTANKRGDLEKL